MACADVALGVAQMKLKFYWVILETGESRCCIEKTDNLSTYDPSSKLVMDGMWNDEYSSYAKEVHFVGEIELPEFSEASNQIKQP